MYARACGSFVTQVVYSLRRVGVSAAPWLLPALWHAPEAQEPVPCKARARGAGVASARASAGRGPIVTVMPTAPAATRARARRRASGCVTTADLWTGA